MIWISTRPQHTQKLIEQNRSAQGGVSFFFIVSLVLSFSFSPAVLLASPSQERAPTNVGEAQTSKNSNLSNTFIHIAQQTKSSVVNIVVKKTIFSPAVTPKRLPILGKPLLRRFFKKSPIPEEEMPLPEGRDQEIASGVIIRSDGYILTNYSVVEHAYEIRIQLMDERIFEAELIGQDRSTDVAILKINASKLRALQWGDSDVLKVGEIVMAIGNPFGLNQTLTIGIISATGRGNVGFVDYESFIQTDADINPGNFGGALVNMKGELIGINSAILHESSGNTGIGFAIPSQMAKSAAITLIKQGKLSRGWIGISTQKLSPDLVKYFNVSHGKGVVITDLAKDGPAARANLKRRDIILEYKGTAITTPRQLQSLITETVPGASITIRRIQKGQEKDVTVKVGDFPVETRSHSRIKQNEDGLVLTGVTVEPVPKEFSGEEGVLVSEIAPGSVLDRRGLEEGDIILDINQTPIRSVKDFERLAKQLGRHDSVLLLLRRENAALFLTLHEGK